MSVSQSNICFLTVLVATSVTGCGKLDEYPTSNDVFDATFGKAPTSSVSGLQGYGTVFFDSSFCYLRFAASFQDVQSLIGSGFNSFSPISPAAFGGETSNAGILGPAPTWWTPTLNNTTKCYASSAFHPTFSRGKAYLAYDTVAGVAYFYWDGVD